MPVGVEGPSVFVPATAPDLRARFPDEARAAAARLHAAVIRGTLASDPHACRTTASVALARPGEGWFGHWSVGDSHVFEVRGGAAHEPCAGAERQIHYLGDAATPREALVRAVRVCASDVGDTRCLVLATDGLSEPGIGVVDPPAAVAEAVAEAGDVAPAARPLEVARCLVARALGSHRARRCGDNIAAAVLWLAEA